MPFALLQKNLTQTIDRKTLEEASVHAPSVARADCARLSSQLFGIVVTGLPYDDALAFQTALEHYRFPTEVVAQEELPRLTPPKFRRGIRVQSNSFTALDGLGREDAHPWDEVQFVAGGFVQTVQVKTVHQMQWAYHGRAGNSVQMTPQAEQGLAQEFRLELFLSCEPWRLQFRAGPETVFRCDDVPLRFQQKEQFLSLLQRVGNLFPHDCLSLGIQAAMRNELFVYPGVPALEEEITWHLFQRLRH